MGFSPLANMKSRIPDGGRSSPRNSKIKGFTIHHNAGVDAYGEATNPRRQVSANYWITNSGTILPNVDENRRAWTTGASGYPAGAASDHRNITVEVSNSPAGVKNGTWSISPAAERALVALIGDVFKRHRLGKVKRGKNSGVAVHRDFVPTSCPGPYIMANLNTIIKNAEKHRTGKKESTMSAKNVWNYRGKDRVNKNASTQENKLSRIHQYVHQLRNLRKDVAGLI
ncbi:MAG TPA: peptidoglycan recognition family protein, partial [Beutenbergiaceae bacterium]|nr:peptidoglycan recognition family protein [Beutenbergiaceae bacterium]